MASSEDSADQHLSLEAAVAQFIASRLAESSDGPKAAPEDGQVWGTIGALMGLSKTERQARQQEILDAFLPAWIAAGGQPRAMSPKKARVEKRKKAIKQIKTRRAEIAKIVAANQRTPIAPKPVPESAPPQQK
jgi:hypothetical protein